jgi:hypothetical protein
MHWPAAPYMDLNAADAVTTTAVPVAVADAITNECVACFYHCVR